MSAYHMDEFMSEKLLFWGIRIYVHIVVHPVE